MSGPENGGDLAGTLRGLSQSLGGMTQTLGSMSQSMAPPAEEGPAPLAPMAWVSHAPVQPPLPARYAEGILWLARYMERVENLARLLEITRTFGQDDRAGRNWLSILRINSDEARFRETYAEVTPEAVARFYVLDAANPTSIRACVAAVRENARTLRALISTEMWLQINVFQAELRALGDADIQPDKLPALCTMVTDAVQSHTGIVEGTFYRDQSWSFYAIGRHLERADQMTRLLDIKAASALAELATARSAGHADVAQWDTLLRAVSGYHAYRRVYANGTTPANVVSFLLQDGAFPRSLTLNLSQLDWQLGLLRTRHGLQGGRAASERLDGLRGVLASVRPAELLDRGLSAFLDTMQRELTQLHADLAAGFFPS